MKYILLFLIVFFFSENGIAQEDAFVLLQDNDKYKLYNYSRTDSTRRKYQITKNHKNPRVNKKLLIYEFEIQYQKTIHRDSLENYPYRNIDNFNFEDPYEFHEIITNNQNDMLVILKSQEHPEGWSRKRFDNSDEYLLKVYRARYMGTKYYGFDW